MREDSHSQAEKQSGLAYGQVILWLHVALLVYVLSFGPMRWAFGERATLQVLYAPVVWAYAKCPPFRAAYDLYMKWDKHW